MSTLKPRSVSDSEESTKPSGQVRIGRERVRDGWFGGLADRVGWRFRGVIGRELAKAAISPLIDWPRSGGVTAGYSVILGVPWHLRHLLKVNLRFLAQLDRQNLRAIHVVLDRTCKSDLSRMEADARAHYPQLPLKFSCYTGLAGRVVEKLDISTFYNSMNCATALAAIDSSHAILHDFDLYPLRADYFERMYSQMVREQLHYCGVEVTCFDGLTPEDLVLGTWGLGMDVAWLRRTHRPIEIFHTVRRLGDRVISLDPFSESQLRPGVRRAIVSPCDPEGFCHVKNLCSSYLRFSTGRRVTIEWRLHYLWYLESLTGARQLADVIERMERSDTGQLEIDGRVVDFTGTHPTCANVLRSELSRMDAFLFGEIRPEVVQYIDAFRSFLGGTSRAGRQGRAAGVEWVEAGGAGDR